MVRNTRCDWKVVGLHQLDDHRLHHRHHTTIVLPGNPHRLDGRLLPVEHIGVRGDRPGPFAHQLQPNLLPLQWTPRSAVGRDRTRLPLHRPALARAGGEDCVCDHLPECGGRPQQFAQSIDTGRAENVAPTKAPTPLPHQRADHPPRAQVTQGHSLPVSQCVCASPSGAHHYHLLVVRNLLFVLKSYSRNIICLHSLTCLVDVEMGAEFQELCHHIHGNILP